MALTGLSLLDQLLDRLARGYIHYLDALASELNIDRELLEQMLLQLERAGYVEQVNLECAQHCTGCAQAFACQLPGGRLWQVTPQGLRVAVRL